MKKMLLLCGLMACLSLVSCTEETKELQSSNSERNLAKSVDYEENSSNISSVISSDTSPALINSEKEDSTNVSSKRQPSSANSHAANSSTSGFQANSNLKKTAQNLLEQLQNNNPKQLTFFYVEGKLSFTGYKNIKNVSDSQKIESFKQITSSDEISKLKDNLKTDKWVAKDFTLKSMPKMYIYFDEDFHINLEAQSYDKKESWMSIHSVQGSVYYLVPNDVYSFVSSIYKE